MKRVLGFWIAIAVSAVARDFPQATPESQGLRSETLCAMSERVRSAGWDVRSILVLRKGHLVLEWYAGDVTRDHNHNVFSITKTVVSCLAGAAVDRGIIKSTSMTLGSIFPKEKGVSSDPVKTGIRLVDLLTMRSGCPVSRANKPAGVERELFDRIDGMPDRLDFMLNDLPMAGEPGASFAYNNIDPALVLASVEQLSRKKAVDFAKEVLFEPLGFENAEWKFADRRGRAPGGYGLRLRAIDLAKLGQLFLQNGDWGGKRLLSSDWIAKATSDANGDGYGYFWWMVPEGCAAMGVRGQRLVVSPKLGLVYVILSDLPPAEVSTITNEIGKQFIIPSVVSDQPLPEDATATAALKSELQEAGRHVPDSRKGLPASRLPSQ